MFCFTYKQVCLISYNMYISEFTCTYPVEVAELQRGVVQIRYKIIDTWLGVNRDAHEGSRSKKGRTSSAALPCPTYVWNLQRMPFINRYVLELVSYPILSFPPTYINANYTLLPPTPSHGVYLCTKPPHCSAGTTCIILKVDTSARKFRNAFKQSPKLNVRNCIVRLVFVTRQKMKFVPYLLSLILLQQVHILYVHNLNS